MCKLSRAGPASEHVYGHCLAPFSWYVDEASRHYHSTVVNSNYCFLKTFSTFDLEGGYCICALWIPVSCYSSKTLCNMSCLVACLAQNIYHKQSLGRKVLVSVITCGLWCLLVCFCLPLPPTLPPPPPICVNEDGIAGPDNGNNSTGNWAALSKIHFGYLIWTKISVACCSRQSDLF